MTKARDIADGVDTADIADGAISTAKIADTAITDAKISGMASSKLTGALPAVDGSALTGISAGLSGPNKEIFTSSGTFTVPSGVTSVKVTVVGGGASGQANRARAQPTSGGGGGGTAIKWITGLTAGDTVAVTVGAGGVGTLSSPYKEDGGTSSFGSYCSATGGQCRINNSTANTYTIDKFGGDGGTATGGDLNITGGKGGNAIYDSNNTLFPTCGGGGRPLGLSGETPWQFIDYPTYGNYFTDSMAASPFGGYAAKPFYAGAASGLSSGYDATANSGSGGSGFSFYNPGFGTGGNGGSGIVIVEY